MTKKLLLTTLLAFASGTLMAQKSMYIPQEWRNRTDTLIYKESDPNNEYTWSKSRSYETDNVIILWDNGYGNTNPSDAPSKFQVDIEDLAQKCEAFYQLECDSLGFVDVKSSNLSKYKVMVLLNHTTDWVCYGGGYDYQVSALWLGPSACQPVGFSVAHEVGHSFHYMCYSEASKQGTLSGVETGFHSAVGSGATIWETTAQWQALQSYPEEVFSQSADIFRFSHNYAFTHEWHRYQSYLFLCYLCYRYGDVKTVADVWNWPETEVKDFNEVLMDCKGLSVEDLYRLHFDYAMHCVTWDMPACEPYRDNYIGRFKYYCVRFGQQTYQVAYASAPQATGFNVIPLAVPEAGEQVSIDFTALPIASSLADGDPAQYLDGDSKLSSSGKTKYNATTVIRNFRLGYVALMDDGTRQYFYEDSLYCHGRGRSTATVSMTVPEGAKRLWFVVSPAPDKYVQHKWNENISDDDQWPYQFTLTGTDLTADATVTDSYMIGDRGVGDITISYSLNMRPATAETDPSVITISGDALYALGTALQMTGSEIASHIVDYNEDGPQPGEIMIYPLNSAGNIVEQASTVAEGYGYWYSKRGQLVEAESSSAALSLTFDPKALTLSFYQVPEAISAGTTIITRLALRYRYSQYTEAIAYIRVSVNVKNAVTGYTAPTIDYDEEQALPVSNIEAAPPASDGKLYDLSGRRVATPARPGIYIKDGRKVLVK